VLLLWFCASKFITSNDCIVERVPSLELVRLPNAQFLSLEVPIDTAYFLDPFFSSFTEVRAVNRVV